MSTWLGILYAFLLGRSTDREGAMETREADFTNTDDPMINIRPIAGGTADSDAQKQLLELQLKMATSSINHEYARIEFEDVWDRERRDDLIEYMHECRTAYFEARRALSAYDPYALEDFEADLMRQKQMTLSGAQAS